MSDAVALRDTNLTPERHMDYRGLMALAKELVTTGFLPAAIKTPAQAVAIILTGQELGLPPMKALRLINVIQGKPCLAAELQLALFKQRGGRAQWVESDDKLATITLIHPNGDKHTETFTVHDAERAGLLKKGGNWTTYPKIMLRWRAASNGLKAIAPDILSGVYDPDEMGAMVDVQTGEIVEMPKEQAQALQPTPPVNSASNPAIITITDVQVKTGTRENGAQWTRYGIMCDNGETYSTFDTKIGEAAQGLIRNKVALSWEKDKSGKYLNCTSVEPSIEDYETLVIDPEPV